VPDGTTPLDHTSILATIEHRWSIPPLTKRDGAAPDVGAALSLSTARTDDPLANVTAPAPPPTPKVLADQPSGLQKLHAAMLAQAAGDARVPANLHTSQDYERFISHTAERV
jgi:phospholipase C